MKSITTFTLLAIGAGLLAATPARAQEEPASPSDRISIQPPRNVDGTMRFENQLGQGILVEIYYKSGKFQKRKTVDSMKADAFSFSGDATNCGDRDRKFKIFQASGKKLLASGQFGFEAEGSARDCIMRLRNQSNKKWPAKWQVEDGAKAVVEFDRINFHKGSFQISRE